MVGTLVAAVLAALTFAICTALGLPVWVATLSAVLVLAASLPALADRFGTRDI